MIKQIFIKFLNNFIAQMTPFLFYSIGGYFVLRGGLSIGSMVAVLVAYKDLSGPWKELLRYYQRKEDIRVKYQQVIEQFNPAGLVDMERIDGDGIVSQLPDGDIRISGLSYSEDGLYFSINEISTSIKPGQHIAIVGASNSGKHDLAYLLSRLIIPTAGMIEIGGENMLNMPESLTGRRIAYLAAGTYIFTGSIRDNLLYPLKHHPAIEQLSDTPQQKNERKQAAEAGTTERILDDQWVDFPANGYQDENRFWQHVQQLLCAVELDEEVYQFGLQSIMTNESDNQLVDKVMQARRQVLEQLKLDENKNLIEPFDQDKYNTNMTVSANLLFGTVYDDDVNDEQLAEHPCIRKVLDQTELTKDFIDLGVQIAEIMLDLFADVEPDSGLFEQFSFISANDLPEFHQLLQRANISGNALIEEDSIRLLSLPLKLIVARHRLGLIDEHFQQRILHARSLIREQAEDHGLKIHFFDKSEFEPRISIMDNILFGKRIYGHANAQLKINKLLTSVVTKLGLRNDIIEAGLIFNVGVGGALLSSQQKQKIGLIRCLLKQVELFIVNDALSILDSSAEKRILNNVCALIKTAIVIWVPSRVKFADHFDRVMVMERGKLVGNETFAELQKNNHVFQQIINDE